MPRSDNAPQSRRSFLKCFSLSAISPLALRPAMLLGQGLPPLQVASAGSIRATLEGPLRQAATQELGLDLRVHAGGADAVARSIVEGSLAADTFISITAEPMNTVIQAGKAKEALPIASTEMVILYSAKSRFASQFADAAAGRRAWWTVLEEPGLRFARSNPADDPSGRSILFTMMLAARKYRLPDLAERVLGSPLNPEQIQPGMNVRAALEDGSVDAAGSYRIATHAGQIPYLPLPADINLSDPQIAARHPDLVLNVAEKTFHVEPLIFYAAMLEQARDRESARRFVNWLGGQRVALTLQTEGFALPGTAARLR